MIPKECLITLGGKLPIVVLTKRYQLSFWCFYVSARVQAEIDREVEQTRLPNVRDRSHLHYTEATLREVMRCSAVVPLALPHFTLCEISENS